MAAKGKKAKTAVKKKAAKKSARRKKIPPVRQFTTNSVRELVRQCGVLDFKYQPVEDDPDLLSLEGLGIDLSKGGWCSCHVM
jgi:hypothetical protein